MRATIVLAMALVMVLTLGLPAGAEYGVWQKVWDPLPYPPGMSNAGNLGVAIATKQEVYTVGLWQNSALGVQHAWRSTNGGMSFECIHELDMSGMTDECLMLLMMNMYLDIQTTGPDNVQVIGFGISPECLETTNFPACWFVCMFQMQPIVEYSNDGGETWEQATVNGAGMMSMITSSDYVDENVGYMTGGPNYIGRTQDGGLTWNKINSPGDNETYFNDIDFLTPELGFLVTGESEDEETLKSSNFSSDLEYAKTMQQYFVHKARYLKDPVYRLQQQELTPGKSKSYNGRIWRTTNGGQTWEQVYTNSGDGFLYVQIIDEDTIWVMGDPHVYTIHPFSLWVSKDGGDNWEDVTANVPAMDLPGATGYAISAMGFNPSGTVGFLGGAAGTAISYKALNYTSIDCGESWNLDEDIAPWGHPIIEYGFANDKMAYTASFDLAVFKYTQDNAFPVAVVGEDQDVAVGTKVTLDGSASYDPDGGDLTYTWTQSSGPDATLDDANIAKPSFTPSEDGEYVFALTVNDGTEDSTCAAATTVNATGGAADDDDDDTTDDDDVTDDDAADDDAADDDDDNDDTDDNGPSGTGDDDDDEEGSCGC